jgi:hypothetical protein
VSHAKQEHIYGAEVLKQGLPRRKRRAAEREIAVIETELETKTNSSTTNSIAISPSQIRHRLALASAESVHEIEEALRSAALGASREHWVTFVCPDCGKKHRAEVQVPDTRARLQALQLWLEQSLGRIGVAEEPSAPQLPASAEAVEGLGLRDVQAFAATFLVDELAALQRHGGEGLLAERVAALSDGEKRVLLAALNTT